MSFEPTKPLVQSKGSGPWGDCTEETIHVKWAFGGARLFYGRNTFKKINKKKDDSFKYNTRGLH